MSRKLLSLGALAAVLTLVPGTTEVQADHYRGQYGNPACCQSRSYSHSIFSIFNRCRTRTQRQVYYTSRQPVNNGCQPQVQQRCQPAQYISSNARCNPQPACRVVQTACQIAQPAYPTSETQTNNLAPAPAPPLDIIEAPPAPGRLSAPAPASAPAPTPAPGR